LAGASKLVPALHFLDDQDGTYYWKTKALMNGNSRRVDEDTLIRIKKRGI
jgi:hypothetical protein